MSWGQADSSCTVFGVPGQFAEMYSYVQAGGVATKRMQVTRPLVGGTQGQQTTAKLDAVFQYDNEGKMTSMKTPDYWITGNPNQQTGETFNYTYDTMARLTGLTHSGVSQALVNSIVYGGANQITQLNYGDGTIQTRTYNARLQVTRMTSGSDLDVEYQYSATTNNGQIGMRWDHLSGEQVTYQYDSLKRLTAAGTTTGAAPWSQTYGYDGFGNRTSLNGAATGYDPATNRMLSASYDGNGNTTSMAGFVASGLVYDIDNRLISASPTSGGLEQYGYNHGNQRVWRKKAGGTEEFYFYNLNGQRLGVFTGATGDGSGNFFFGRVSLDSVIPKGLQRKRDRLGSTFDGGTTRYFPYGEENPATSTNDRDKFATYQRDSTTGLDYAVNRYDGSTMGRFLTADPYPAKVTQPDPGAWNKYSYSRSDPVGRYDPEGTDDCVAVPVWDPWTQTWVFSCNVSAPIAPYGSLFGDMHWWDFPTRVLDAVTYNSRMQSAAQERLPGARDNAKKALSIDSCKKLLQGSGGLDPSAVLAGLNSALTGYGTISFDANLSAQGTVSPNLWSVHYQFGQGGGVYYGSVSIQIGASDNLVAGWNSGSDFDRVRILLHELAHAIALLQPGNVNGFGKPDGNPLDAAQVAQQNTNNRLINENCLDPLKKLLGL